MAGGWTPDLVTQKNLIVWYLSRNMKKGESWYLVDMRWFKQWKKYVGYDQWDFYTLGHPAAHPGPIDNCSLLKPDSTVLRDYLIDNVDYMLLPDEAYKKLASWYGEALGQEPIIRKVIEQGMFVKHCKVEVYLLRLKLRENSDPTTVITRYFSRLDTIATIEQEMRKRFSIPDEKEVRLWKGSVHYTFEQLNKKDITLQEADLIQGQVIDIEAKNDDGTWPRQNKSLVHPLKGTEFYKSDMPGLIQLQSSLSYVYRGRSDFQQFTKFVSGGKTFNKLDGMLFNVRAVDSHEGTARMNETVFSIVPKNMMNKATKKRPAENGEDFTSAKAHLEALLSKASLSKLVKKDQCASATGDSESPDCVRLAEENRQLKEQKLCKICMDEEVCVAFIHCGHLVSCSTCAPTLNQCPICRAKIQGTIRTYMS